MALAGHLPLHELARRGTDPELAAAAAEFELFVTERQFEGLARWIATRRDEPVEWQEAAAFGDSLLYLTAAGLGAGAAARDIGSARGSRHARGAGALVRLGRGGLRACPPRVSAGGGCVARGRAPA